MTIVSTSTPATSPSPVAAPPPERVRSGSAPPLVDGLIWAGAPSPPLVVGYVLKMFPRFSETFILNELLELQHLGVRLVVFSMKQPDEPMVQPRVTDFRGQVFVIPAGTRAVLCRHLPLHLACLGRSPLRYVQTLIFTARRRSAPAWKKFLVAPYVVRTARAMGVEHLHAHFASGPARLAKLTSMLSGIPFSFTAHAKDLFWNGHQHGKNKKLKKRVRLSSFVVTISDYNQRFIRNLGFKIPNRRLVTVPNGLSLSHWPFLRPDGRPLAANGGQPPLVLAVGRLVGKKGFDDLIAAARVLRERGTRFRCVIVGEGPERPALLDLIRRHGLEEQVELAGAIAQDRLLTDFYARSTVLVQPSVRCADGDQDGIPTVIIEALACGVPVVATGISGIGEAVIDDRTGLVVRTGDVDGLATAIERVIAEPMLAAQLARGGRRLVESRFNLRNNAKVLVHLFVTAARGRARWSERKLRRRVGLEPAPMADRVTAAPLVGAGTRGTGEQS